MQSPQGPSILEKYGVALSWLKQLSRVWTLSRNSSRHHTAAEFYICWCVIPEKVWGDCSERRSFRGAPFFNPTIFV
ncbi:hypothetical protein GHT06_018882 [Daphnia sinensis]|uniref:Uncharacterized protein n=1 Tax=Daphnia sinensis TaxID=1820382 RepID=A0AAD5LEP3_9CRUS|nr:hypothetical protein GHT06_018882 [Daphnia sinensis]